MTEDLSSRIEKESNEKQFSTPKVLSKDALGLARKMANERGGIHIEVIDRGKIIERELGLKKDQGTDLVWFAGEDGSILRRNYGYCVMDPGDEQIIISTPSESQARDFLDAIRTEIEKNPQYSKNPNIDPRSFATTIPAPAYRP